MSSQLISELFRAVDASDWNGLVRVFHDDIVYERPGYNPIVGVEHLLQFYQQERVIASGKHYIEQVVIDGSHGACWGRFTGTKKDGSEIEVRFADVYTFDDGGIKARRSHFYRPVI